MINYKLKEQGIDVVDTVLTNRGLTAQQVEAILNPNHLEVIESPMLLKNMDKAIEKVTQAIKEGKLIVIPVDSDCDGWCSAGQLYHYIRYTLGYENVVYIFHSNSKAHGFTDHIVKELKERKAGLIIMADGGCGDEDRKKYQTVLDNGTDIVILDHHPFEGVYQDEVALVNCQQSGQESKNINLSGAGVVHKFLQAFSAEVGNPHEVEKYIDLVALSLVSDMMDLKELENRALLNIGVKEECINSPFIKKLMEKKKIEKYLTIEELGFTVAPLINATVRIGKLADKEKVFRSLFISEDVESEKRGEKGKGIFVPIEEEAVRIATNMKSNQDKKRDKSMEQLIEESDKLGLDDGKVFIADVTEYMDAEISGLVANKMLGNINKPIMLLREGKGRNGFTGSVRGVSENKDVPSFKKVVQDTGITSFCSGHDNAFGVGISIDTNEVTKLKKEIKESIETKFKDDIESGDMAKKDINKIVTSVLEEKLSELSVNKLCQLKESLNNRLKNIEFFSGFEVDGIYNGAVPLSHVKAIGKYEDLWCSNIKAPLFLVKGVRMHTDDIEKTGNATYKFKLGDVRFTKNYGSKVWYQTVTQEDKLPFGGSIIADIVCKFRKSKSGYYWCDIVHMVSKEDTEAIDF